MSFIFLKPINILVGLFFLKSNQINKVILNTKKNKESKAEQWCESIGWGQLRQTTFR